MGSKILAKGICNLSVFPMPQEINCLEKRFLDKRRVNVALLVSKQFTQLIACRDH